MLWRTGGPAFRGFEYYSDSRPVGGGEWLAGLTGVKGRGKLPGNRPICEGVARYLYKGRRPTPSAQKHCLRYERQFADATLSESIESYNQEISVTGWMSALASKLAALQREFDRRLIDASLSLEPGGNGMRMNLKIALDSTRTWLVPAGELVA